MSTPKPFMPYLHDHATAIGYLCIYYSALEHQVDRLLGDLTRLDEEELRIVTTDIDLTKKLPKVKALAFAKKPSDLWYADVDLFTWAVLSWINPRRNRFVHDQWLSLPTGTFRLYERTKIAKAKSREPETLTTYERIAQNSEDVWELASEARDMASLFRHLGAAFRTGRAAAEPEKAFPPQYRDQWLARRTSQQEAGATARRGPDLGDRIHAQKTSSAKRRKDAMEKRNKK
jgi:hypothetical protein